MKRSHENGSRPLQDTQHHKQKHCTKRGNQNAAQQATSGEAGEATQARADEALYAAKNGGRNRVELA